VDLDVGASQLVRGFRQRLFDDLRQQHYLTARRGRVGISGYFGSLHEALHWNEPSQRNVDG